MALSTPRITPQRKDAHYGTIYTTPMATATTLYKGGMVQVNAAGYAVAASATAANVCMGVLGDQPFGVPADRITNSGANGAKTCEVRAGTFKIGNDGTDPVTIAHVGDPCYVVDDETVSSSSNSSARPVAGIVVGIDDSTSPTGAGVWVSIVKI